MAEFSVFFRGRVASPVTLPWEEGYAGLVFGEPQIDPLEDLLPAAPPPLPRPAQVLEQERCQPQPKRFRTSGRAVPIRPAQQDQGLLEWLKILQAVSGDCTLGRTLTAEGKLDEADLVDSLSAVFGVKSPATVMKRAYAVRGFLSWYGALPNPGPKPITEPLVFGYLQHLSSSRAPPTRGLSLLESLAFMAGTIGLDNGVAISRSGRCKGLAAKMASSKRALHQAPPLTQQMVTFLEDFLTYANRAVDRVAAGHFLFCIYTCARFSDSQKASGVQLDMALTGVGIVSASVLDHKTSRSSSAKNQLLPLMGLAKGLTSSCWAQLWMKARLDTALPDASAPLLLSPSSSSTWQSRALSTSEATAWLRDILAEGPFSQEEVQAVSSHSLKATLLSWMAKYGLPIDDRRLMGHHLDPQYKSVVTYSRDALTCVLEKVMHLIAKMRIGSFKPDLSPAERLAHQSSGSGVDHLQPRQEQVDHLQPRQEQVDTQPPTPTELADGHNIPLDVQSVADSVVSLQQPKATSLLEFDLPAKGDPEELQHLLMAPIASARPPSVASSVSSESDEVSLHPEAGDATCMEEMALADYTLMRHAVTACVHGTARGLKFLCGRTVTWRFEEFDLPEAARWPLCQQCQRQFRNAQPS